VSADRRAASRRNLQSYGAGVGLSLGAGVGGTAALLAGLQSDFATVAGFGVAGGLVVGAAVGGFAGAERARPNWRYRVTAYTLLVSLLAGGLLGALTGWLVDASLATGVAVGSAAGGAFGLLLSGVLVAAGGERDPEAADAD
jgi:hypothetical protein